MGPAEKKARRNFRREDGPHRTFLSAEWGEGCTFLVVGAVDRQQLVCLAVVDLERCVADSEAIVEHVFEFAADLVTVVSDRDEDVC